MNLESTHKKIENIEEINEKKDLVSYRAHIESLKKLFEELPKEIVADMDIDVVKKEEKREYNSVSRLLYGRKNNKGFELISTFGKKIDKNINNKKGDDLDYFLNPTLNSKKEDNNVMQEETPLFENVKTERENDEPVINEEIKPFDSDIIFDNKEEKKEEVIVDKAQISRNNEFEKINNVILLKIRELKSKCNVRDIQGFLRTYSKIRFINGDVSLEHLDRMYQFLFDIESYLESIDNILNQRKEELKNIDMEINEYIDYIKPYMNVPKINQEMTKAINKNKELDSMSLNRPLDYTNVINDKKKILLFLTKAKEVIDRKVEENKKDEYQEMINEIEKKDEYQEMISEIEKEDRKNIPGTDEFWDDFMAKGDNSRRFTGRMLDDNGLFTWEFIGYVMQEDETAAYQMIESNKKKINLNDSNGTLKM